MRHKTAAQQGEGGGWHYVSMNRRGGYPLGYCAEHEPHPTEAEARECYGRYLREQTIRLYDGTCSWTSCHARPNDQRCPNPTRGFASWGDDGYGMVPLCPEHMTVEHVIARARIAGPAGDAWVS